MADIIRIPGGVNITAGVGDVPAANGVINKPVTPCVTLSAVQITRGA